MSEASRQTLLGSLPTSFETGPDWLRALRGRAADTLREQGLPTKRTEAWRFTPVRSIVDAEFSREHDAATSLVSELPEGVTARSLKEVLGSQPDLLEGRLGLGGAPSHFAALNTALFREGIWIDVPAGIVAEAPIEISHLAPSASEPGVVYPRVLVTVGQNAELSLIETYLGDEPRQLSNSLVEVDLSRNAKMSHVRVHEQTGLQIGRVDVRQDADSGYRSTVVTLGGALLRSSTAPI